jgi:hypothetical protein
MNKSPLSRLLSPQFSNALGRSLGEEFPLCDNHSVVFHWADFFETCDEVKNSLEKDAELKGDFNRLLSKLSRLKSVPVWIRTPGKVFQSSMFSLYEKHILRNSHLEGLDFFGPMEVSLISGTGPFKTMALSEFFHKETYQQFVLVGLINGELPKRDFRIRFKAKILMEYGENLESSTLVSFEQLTKQGILFQINADTYLKEVCRHPKVNLIIDSTLLGECLGKDLDEVKHILSNQVHNLLYSSRIEHGIEADISKLHASSSFEFLKDHKKFIFIPFGALTAVDPEGVKRLIQFVDHAQGLVRNFYQQKSKAA